MRLLTHNALRNPAKDAALGLALLLEIESFDMQENDFNSDFISRVLPTLNWEGVLIAAKAIGMSESLPPLFSADLLDDDDFLRASFQLLINVEISAGTLICAETGRRFPIKNGIPCMM